MTDPLAGADWEALARYISGEGSPEEAVAIRLWLAEDSARAALVQQLDGTLSSTVLAPPVQVDVEAALARVMNRLSEPEVISLDQRRTANNVRRRGWVRPFLRVAATVLLLLGGGLIFWRFASPPGSPALAARELETGMGQQLMATLVDGTRIRLGPSTRLVIRAGYGRDGREVELTGEALFEVHHDEALPFTVHAAGSLIEDLGTTFTVRSQGDEVRVAVTEGVVRLRGAGSDATSGATLEAGDRATLSDRGVPIVETDVPLDADLAWTRGELVFDRATLEDVAGELQRWYGVQAEAARIV